MAQLARVLWRQCPAPRVLLTMCLLGVRSATVPVLERSNNNGALLLLAVNFFRCVAVPSSWRWRRNDWASLPPLSPHTCTPSSLGACSKLSIFEENMRDMASLGVVGYLARLVPVNQEVLLSSVLRLLYNLSFEPSQQSAMVAAGLVPKLVATIPLVPLRPTVLRVLYHIRCARCRGLAPRVCHGGAALVSRDHVYVARGGVQHGRAIDGSVRDDARHPRDS